MLPRALYLVNWWIQQCSYVQWNIPFDSFQILLLGNILSFPLCQDHEDKCKDIKTRQQHRLSDVDIKCLQHHLCYWTLQNCSQAAEGSSDGWLYFFPSSQLKHEQALVGFGNLACIVSMHWKDINKGYTVELGKKACFDKIWYDNQTKQWISMKQQNKKDLLISVKYLPTINTVPATSSNLQNDENSISLRSSKNILSHTYGFTCFLENQKARHVSNTLHCSLGPLKVREWGDITIINT